MDTTLTVIVMGLIVVGIGAVASLWPLSEEEKRRSGFNAPEGSSTSGSRQP